MLELSSVTFLASVTRHDVCLARLACEQAPGLCPHRLSNSGTLGKPVPRLGTLSLMDYVETFARTVCDVVVSLR